MKIKIIFFLLMFTSTIVFNGYSREYELKKVGNKLFKLHCNHCLHEWEGGAFDFQCPECSSTDFVPLPNG